MVESEPEHEKGRISVSIGKGSNQCEYRKMVESGRVPRKGRIRASIEKISRRVPEKGRLSVSTEKWLNSGEYREMVESVRVLTTCCGEYRMRVELV